jgi:uncharacterized protein YeaO (DUF488 family)
VSGVRIKRVYESADEADGVRVLVDRLWPRGFTKERASVDHWMKEVAPSTELRKWFGRDPERWDEFRARYLAELEGSEAVERLRELAHEGVVTLVYSVRDEERNHAILLRELLKR